MFFILWDDFQVIASILHLCVLQGSDQIIKKNQMAESLTNDGETHPLPPAGLSIVMLYWTPSGCVDPPIWIAIWHMKIEESTHASEMCLQKLRSVAVVM